MQEIISAVTSLGVKSKPAPPEPSEPERLRLRVGGYDLRKQMFKGWIEVEPFIYHGDEGSFCVMQRDQVCLCYLLRKGLLRSDYVILGKPNIMATTVEGYN